MEFEVKNYKSDTQTVPLPWVLKRGVKCFKNYFLSFIPPLNLLKSHSISGEISPISGGECQQLSPFKTFFRDGVFSFSN